MKTITLYIFILLGNITLAQRWSAYYQGIVDDCTLASVTNNINEFVTFGEKNAASNTTKYNNLVSAKDWIKNKYQSYGYTDIVEDSFTYNGRTVSNIVVTKMGDTYPNIFVIIDGHYDTIGGVGANDNGSGTSLLLEIARVIKDVPTAYSIKFIHFTVEEQGLFGSKHYADITSAGLDIRYVFNIDEVGGISGMTNDTITCERDQGNPSSNNYASQVLTDELATSMTLYSSLNTNLSYAYASDYMPFEDNGEVITGLFETNESPYRHTSNDIIANMDIPYVFEITKGALGALLYFAQANQQLAQEDLQDTLQEIKIFPNPVKENIQIYLGSFVTQNIDIRVVNVLGSEVFKTSIKNSKKQESLSLSQLESGVYFVYLYVGNKLKTHKFIKK